MNKYKKGKFVGHGYRFDKFSGINKKKAAVTLLFACITLIVVSVIVGVIIVAIINALLGKADTNVVQSIGNIIASLWNYALDFINALWKQAISNPLNFITGGNS